MGWPGRGRVRGRRARVGRGGEPAGGQPAVLHPGNVRGQPPRCLQCLQCLGLDRPGRAPAEPDLPKVSEFPPREGTLTDKKKKKKDNSTPCQQGGDESFRPAPERSPSRHPGWGEGMRGGRCHPAKRRAASAGRGPGGGDRRRAALSKVQGRWLVRGGHRARSRHRLPGSSSRESAQQLSGAPGTPPAPKSDRPPSWRPVAEGAAPKLPRAPSLPASPQAPLPSPARPLPC